MPNEVDTHAIPFFGPIEGATVLTVGVNPSWMEFRNRNWPENLSAPELAERLRNYSSSDKALPHPWFSRWGEGLNLLGVKYGVSAAHLDLSPRATRAMASCEAGAFRGPCSDVRQPPQGSHLADLSWREAIEQVLAHSSEAM